MNSIRVPGIGLVRLLGGGGVAAGVSSSVSISPFVCLSQHHSELRGFYVFSVSKSAVDVNLFDVQIVSRCRCPGLGTAGPLSSAHTSDCPLGPTGLDGVLCLCPVFGPLGLSRLLSKSTVPYFKKFKNESFFSEARPHSRPLPSPFPPSFLRPFY